MRNKAKSLCRQCKTLFNTVHCILYSARCTCILIAKGDFFSTIKSTFVLRVVAGADPPMQKRIRIASVPLLIFSRFYFFSFSIFCPFLAQGNFPCPIYFHSSITGSPNTFSHSRPHAISLASAS